MLFDMNWFDVLIQMRMKKNFFLFHSACLPELFLKCLWNHSTGEVKES